MTPRAGEGVVETVALRPGYRISRLIKGGWQLAGDHGPVAPERAVADMAEFADAGIVAFDCADIYTGVEEMIGAFLARVAAARGSACAAGIKVHTKYVPDLEALARIDRGSVARVIDRSLARLGRERLDLVQFHWWDFASPGWTECAGHLAALQAEGKIDRIGVTNFDERHLAEIIESGVDVVSAQVQYSLLDRRPEGGFIEWAGANGVAVPRLRRACGGLPHRPLARRGRTPASRSRTARSSSTGSSSRSSGDGAGSRISSGRSAASPTAATPTSRQ